MVCGNSLYFPFNLAVNLKYSKSSLNLNLNIYKIYIIYIYIYDPNILFWGY